MCTRAFLWVGCSAGNGSLGKSRGKGLFMPLALDPRALDILLEKSRCVEAGFCSHVLPDFHFRLCMGANAENAAVLGEVLNADSTTAGAEKLDSSGAEEWFGAIDGGTEALPPGDGGCVLERSLGTVKIECGLVIDKSLLGFVA